MKFKVLTEKKLQVVVGGTTKNFGKSQYKKCLFNFFGTCK